MKKNIGNYNACFPTPIVVVGAMVDGRPNWFEVAWVGIGDRDIITMSVTPTHKTCEGIFAEKKLSISLVDQPMLQKADYVGIVSGSKVDKSEVFPWEKGELGTPVPTEAPVVMECELLDTYTQHGMNLLVCRVKHTYVEEDLTKKVSPTSQNSSPYSLSPASTICSQATCLVPAFSQAKPIKHRATAQSVALPACCTNIFVKLKNALNLLELSASLGRLAHFTNPTILFLLYSCPKAPSLCPALHVQTCNCARR